MITAIVLAAGQGTRFSSEERPKQFSLINGTPIFIHAIRRYMNDGCADRIVLLASRDRYAEIAALLEACQLQQAVLLAPGGATRRESISNGLNAAIEAWRCGVKDHVVLHNAASPNTPVATIRACIAGLAEADIAQAYIPQVRTQFSLAGNRIVRVPQRDGLVTACDPTAFRVDALQRVLEHCRKLDLAGDSTTDIALQLGLSIVGIPSTHANIKVTTPWDLAAVAAAMQADTGSDKAAAGSGIAARVRGRA